MNRSADIFAKAKRIVVKVGSALLIDPDSGAVNRERMAVVAADLIKARAQGRDVVVVSSGAVGLGRRRLGLKKSASLPEKQAAAAVGQSLLMRAWEEAFEPHGVVCAQVLITPEDTEARRRWLNARATLETLLGLKVIPVINENDTIATEELRYGDNDRLAARVTQMVGADGLILLSDVDGLYTADPRLDPSATHLEIVEAVTPQIEAMAGGINAAAGVGSGGMATKIEAAKIAGAAGAFTIITRGDRPEPLTVIATPQSANTLFQASGTAQAAYKARIAGLRRDAIEAALGYTAGPMIHADDLSH